MARTKARITIFVLASLLLTSGILSTPNLKQKNDETFQEFLSNATDNFTSWLEDNKLDPTQPIQDPLIIESVLSLAVFLKCELRNQTLNGYSSNNNQSWSTESLFQEHTFSIVRQHNQTYMFEGNFNCKGNISAMDEEFSFSGNGVYQMHTNRTEEFAVYTNIGITRDYKLNFNLSYLDYGLFPTVSFRLLAGRWNDSRIINKYSSIVMEEFVNLYSNYLRNPLKYGAPHLHPTVPLLNGYILSFTQDLDLTTILDPADLPLPYIPTSPPPSTTSKTSY